MGAIKILILIFTVALPGLADSFCLPRPDHIVIVIEENHSNQEILGPGNSCPYINSLAATGANMLQSFAIEHPSEPNYLDIFTGSNQGVTNDDCVSIIKVDNLGSQLIKAGYSFCGYAEGLPSAGSTICWDVKKDSQGSHSYARKHVPWAFISNLPASTNQPFTAFQALKGKYASLPTISIVIPNLENDMHDGNPAVGDRWLKANLDGYIQWAKKNNSLFILTWDEDDTATTANRIPTLFLGPMVVTGANNTIVNHFNLLRTLEDMYGLPHAGKAETAAPITAIFIEQCTPVASSKVLTVPNTSIPSSNSLATAAERYQKVVFFLIVFGTLLLSWRIKNHKLRILIILLTLIVALTIGVFVPSLFG